MEKNAKIVPFFYRERKRTQRSFRSFIKNGKERKDRSVLLKRTDAQPCLMHIYRCIGSDHNRLGFYSMRRFRLLMGQCVDLFSGMSARRMAERSGSDTVYESAGLFGFSIRILSKTIQLRSVYRTRIFNIQNKNICTNWTVSIRSHSAYS